MLADVQPVQRVRAVVAARPLRHQIHKPPDHLEATQSAGRLHDGIKSNQKEENYLFRGREMGDVEKLNRDRQLRSRGARAAESLEVTRNRTLVMEVWTHNPTNGPAWCRELILIIFFILK